MQSAQLEIMPEEQADTALHVVEPEAESGGRNGRLADVESANPSPLRQQMAERLAAHRQRRAKNQQDAPSLRAESSIPSIERRTAPTRKTATPMPPRGPASKQGKIAALIAERYAQSPSYRAFLAQEAERSIQQAAAAAEIAQRNAAAVVVAQRELLAELAQWTAPQEFSSETAHAFSRAHASQVGHAPTAPAADTAEAHTAEAPPQPLADGRLTVQLYANAGRPFEPATGMAAPRVAVERIDIEEARALDEEIAFRQAPVFEEYRIEPNVALPANLLEFPRQLVAARKVRPRLAEGPLRQDPASRNPQLRIFEAEIEHLSTHASAVAEAPEWTSIWLDAHARTEPAHEIDRSEAAVMTSSMPPQTAPLQLRIMAGVVDAMLVASGFLAFCTVSVRMMGAVQVGAPVGLAAAATLAVLYALYKLLFFTFSDQTPGMRYARIGLCTFADENPSRAAMRRRLLAQLIALCPLGLGYLWALLDEDRLGWHDRISRMYPRAY